MTFVSHSVKMPKVSHSVKMPKISGTYKVPWILKILHDLNKVMKDV